MLSLDGELLSLDSEFLSLVAKSTFKLLSLGRDRRQVTAAGQIFLESGRLLSLDIIIKSACRLGDCVSLGRL